MAACDPLAVVAVTGQHCEMTSDPSDEADAEWCVMQRQKVLDYLTMQDLVQPTVSEWPAWHVAPIVSVWAVESVKRPGSVGW